MVHASSSWFLEEEGISYSAGNALKINDFWSVRCSIGRDHEEYWWQGDMA